MNYGEYWFFKSYVFSVNKVFEEESGLCEPHTDKIFDDTKANTKINQDGEKNRGKGKDRDVLLSNRNTEDIYHILSEKVKCKQVGHTRVPRKSFPFSPTGLQIHQSIFKIRCFQNAITTAQYQTGTLLG